MMLPRLSVCCAILGAIFGGAMVVFYVLEKFGGLLP
jgi:hypothetical protein